MPVELIISEEVCHERFIDNVFESKGDEHGGNPIPLMVIRNSRQQLQHVDTDWPTNYKNAEGNYVEPVVISVYFGFIFVDVLINLLYLMFVKVSLCLLDQLIFMKIRLVVFPMKDVPENVGKRQCSNEGHHCRPNDH